MRTSLIPAALLLLTAYGCGAAEQPEPPRPETQMTAPSAGEACEQLNARGEDRDSGRPLRCRMDPEGETAQECELQAGGPLDFDDPRVTGEQRAKYIGAYDACVEAAGDPKTWQDASAVE